MTESIWSSAEGTWQEDAGCKAADPEEFFPPVESPASLTLVQDRYCNSCLVRNQCLNFALINGDSGYWGGTDSAQRRAMGRKRDRVKCPLCANDGVVRTDEHQVCVKCGASWRTDAIENHLVVVKGGAEQ